MRLLRLAHPCVALRPLQGGLPTEHLTLQQSMECFERSLLVDAMEEHGNQYKVAAAMGINQSTVARKLKRYGIVC